MTIGRHYSAGARSRDIYHDVKVGGGDLKAGMPNTLDMTVESYRVLYHIKKRKTRKAYNYVPYPFPIRRNSHGVGMDLKHSRFLFNVKNSGAIAPAHVYRPVWNGTVVKEGDVIESYTSPVYNNPSLAYYKANGITEYLASPYQRTALML
jgi:hypothetical protein